MLADQSSERICHRKLCDEEDENHQQDDEDRKQMVSPSQDAVPVCVLTKLE